MTSQLKTEVYFSGDVETDGRIPGRYSMRSFASIVAGSFDGETFSPGDFREPFTQS